MLRKLFAIGSALAMLLGYTAINPAEAHHTLDNVASNVTGGVNIGDPENGLGDCKTDPGDEDGIEVQFTDVLIDGLFTAGSLNSTPPVLKAFEGQVDVDTVTVCLVKDEEVELPDGRKIPIVTHGTLASADFRSPEPGNTDNCLYGSLLGGTFEGAGAVFAEATVQATWQIHDTKNDGCDPLDKGAQLASSAASVDLIADTLTVPLGEITDGEEENQVSSTIHTVHANEV